MNVDKHSKDYRQHYAYPISMLRPYLDFDAPSAPDRTSGCPCIELEPTIGWNSCRNYGTCRLSFST
jgi:hypothetical protein